MNRNMILVTMLVFALLLAGCNKQQEPVETMAPTEVVTEPAVEETVPDVTVPGLERSEFDDVTEPTAEETLPEETIPATEPEVTSKPSDSGKPTQTNKPEVAEPEATKPEATEPKPTEPKPTEPKPTEPKPTEKNESEYESFQNMDASQQKEHMDSFGSIDEFFDWYNKAKEEHEAANPPIDVGDGTVDMGDLMGKNG